MAVVALYVESPIRTKTRALLLRLFRLPRELNSFSLKKKCEMFTKALSGCRTVGFSFLL